MNAVEYCLLHGLKLAGPEHPAILCAQELLSYGALAARHPKTARRPAKPLRGCSGPMEVAEAIRDALQMSHEERVTAGKGRQKIRSCPSRSTCCAGSYLSNRSSTIPSFNSR